MDQNLVSAAKTIEKNHLLTFISENVKQIGGLFGKEKILVISSEGICVLTKDGDKIEQEISWFDIDSYNCSANNVFSVVFSSKQKKISFELAEKSQILNIFETCLQRILLPKEMHKLNHKLRFDPTPKSALIRTKVLHRSIIKEVNKTIRFSEETVTISEDNLKDYCDLLPFIKTIVSLRIILPITDENNLKILLDFLSKEKNLLHIYFDGDINNSIQDFSNVLIDNKQSKIKAFSFSESNFNETSFNVLSMLCNKLEIDSLSFHNAFQPENMYIFYNKFMNSLKISPYFISMKKTKDISIQNIISSKTVVLSLEECSLDISTVLEHISLNKKNYSSLRILNISHNNCTKKLTRDLTLPQGIRSLFATNIKWLSSQMRTFLEIVFGSCNSGLRLSFSYSDAVQDDWIDLNDFLSKTRFNSLKAINWSGNPITKNFISFLRRNKGINAIEMSGCFTEDFPNYVEMFGSYIEDAKNLEKIIIKGTEEKHLGKQIGSILKRILKNESINDIDLSYNYGGDEALYQISSFASSIHNHCKVNFDGTYPESLEKFLQVIDNILSLGKHKVKLSFPDKDAESFYCKGFSKRAYVDLMKKFANTYTHKMEDGPFEGPFRVPKCNDEEKFPEYLPIEELNELFISVTPNKKSPEPHHRRTPSPKVIIIRSESAKKVKKEEETPKAVIKHKRRSESAKKSKKEEEIQKTDSNHRKRSESAKKTPKERNVINEKQTVTNMEEETPKATIKHKRRSESAKKNINEADRHKENHMRRSESAKKGTNEERKHRRHRISQTLTGDENLGEVKPLRKNKRKVSVSKTQDGEEFQDDIINGAISSLFGESEIAGRQRRILLSKSNSSAKKNLKQACTQTNEPQTLQEDVKPLRRRHRHHINIEKDAIWEFPDIPRYQIPETMWEELNDKYSPSSLIKNITE